MIGKLGVIGVGEFAAYLVDGFMRADPDLEVVLSPRGRAHAAGLARRYGHRIATDNQDVVDSADVVLVATRPAQVDEALAGLDWRAGQLAISVAAGISLDELSSRVAPARAALCMPTNSAMIGASPVPFHPPDDETEKVLAALGEPVAIADEKLFEAAAVLGAYYGWVLRLLEQSADWMVDKGFEPAQARRLLTALLRGAADVADHRADRSLGELVDELRTPGGITSHGLDRFAESGALDEWPKVMQSVLDRLAERY